MFESAEDEERLLADIHHVGYNSEYFGTPKAGQLRGSTIEIVHLYPVNSLHKTSMSYDHCIAKIDLFDQEVLLVDVKLENIRKV